MKQKEYLGISIGELANMSIALDMINEDYTAADYMKIMAYADEITNELPEDKRDMLTLAMILTTDASRLFGIFLQKNTPEEWGEMVENWYKTHKDNEKVQ